MTREKGAAVLTYTHNTNRNHILIRHKQLAPGYWLPFTSMCQ